MVDDTLGDGGPSATVRTVRVRMDAEVAGYIRDVTAAGEATRRAFSQMDGINRDLDAFNTHVGQTSQGVDDLGASSSRVRTQLSSTERSMQGMSTTAGQMGQSVRRAANDVKTAQAAIASASSKVEAAQRREADTAGRLRIAELALNDLRQSGNASATRLAAAEERVAAATRAHTAAATDLTRAESDVEAATNRLTTVQAKATSNTDKLAKSAKSAGDKMNWLVTGAIALGPALLPLATVGVPTMAGFTAGTAAAAAAIGVTALALHGLSDGLKALDTYNADPTQKNFTAMQAALAKLGPEGADMVRLIDELEPKLRELQIAARAGLFPGLEDSITKLLPYFPQVKSFIHSISSEMGALTMRGTDNLINDPGWEKFFRFVKTEGVPTLDAWARATGNVATGLAAIVSDFGPEINGFDQGLLDSSRTFKTWAEGLDRNSGSFKDFLDYIHREGPEARAFFTALVQALLGVAEAVAPWGAAVLPVLTSLLQILAALAKSPAGPVLFSTAAGLLAVNKAISIFAGSSGLRAGITSIGTFLTALKTLRSDLALTRAAASAPIVNGTAALPAGYLASRGRINTVTSGLASVGKTGAGLVGAGLAVNLLTSHHSAGVNIGEGAAAGALIGTSIAPGVGTAVGGVVGALGGLTKSLLSTSDAAGKVAADWSSIGQTLTAGGKATPGTAGYISAQLQNSGVVDTASKYGITQQQLVQAAISGNSTGITSTLDSKVTAARPHSTSDTTGITNYLQTAKDAKTVTSAVAAASKAFQSNQKAAQSAAAGETEYASANESAAEAAKDAGNRISELIDAMKAQHQQALANSNAEIAYHQSLADTAAQVAKHTKGLNLDTAAGRANRTALNNQISAYNAQSDAVKNNARNYDNAKAALNRFATQMGATKGQIHSLDDLLDKPRSFVITGTDTSLAKVRALKNEIDLIKSKNVEIHASTFLTGPRLDAEGPNSAKGSAGGSTVPKDGGPYADRYLYMLAPGEEVISNRFGQADRNRGLLKQINANRLADGGTVGDWVNIKDLPKIWKKHPKLKHPLFNHEGPDEYGKALRHNKAFARKPADPTWPWQSSMRSQKQEREFEAWVQKKNVPFDLDAKHVDYDMRGYWLKTRGKGWGGNGQHFPDTFKTPFDTTFSHESKYATKDAPFYWVGNRLVDLRHGQVVFAADGSTVGGRGSAYRDRIPYLLAPGEEVISNRFGQADRNRALLKKINANRAADGGTVGSSRASTTTTTTLSPAATAAAERERASRIKELTGSIKELTHREKDIADRLTKLGNKLDQTNRKLDNAKQAAASLSQMVQAGLTRDLLSPPATSSVFATSGSGSVATFGSIETGLRGERKDARQLTRLEKQLRARGLSRAALAYILSAPDPLAAAQEFDKGTRSQLTGFSSLYGTTRQALTTAGNTAGQLVYGKEIARLEREVKSLKEQVHTEHVADRKTAREISADEARRSKARSGSKSARTRHYTKSKGT